MALHSPGSGSRRRACVMVRSAGGRVHRIRRRGRDAAAAHRPRHHPGRDRCRGARHRSTAHGARVRRPWAAGLFAVEVAEPHHGPDDGSGADDRRPQFSLDTFLYGQWSAIASTVGMPLQRALEPCSSRFGSVIAKNVDRRLIARGRVTRKQAKPGCRVVPAERGLARGDLHARDCCRGSIHR